MGGIGARRGMLTAGVSLAPFMVGETNLTSSGSSPGQDLIGVTPTSPALRTGTLSSASVTVASAGTIYILTGSLNAGTGAFVVTAITGALSASLGANTFNSLGLAINSGDRIGYYVPAFPTGADPAFSGASPHLWYKTPATLPTSGTSMTLVDAGANTALCLQGTGT